MRVLKIILKLLLAILLLSMLAMTVTRAVIVGMTAEKIGSSLGDTEAIVVLGAGVKPDRTPSEMLRKRLDKAFAVWQTNKELPIIVTGDHRPGEYDEVDVMREYLIVKNVPEEKILRDYEGFSTRESMDNVAALSYSKVTVITQEYHLYRTIYIGEKLGLTMEGIAAEDSTDKIGNIYRALREIVATAKDVFLFGIKK